MVQIWHIYEQWQMRSVNGKCLSPLVVKEACNIAYDADGAAFSHCFLTFSAWEE